MANYTKDIDTLKTKITELEAMVQQVKEILYCLEKTCCDSPTPPNKRWRADEDENYYYITAGGAAYISAEVDTSTDDTRYELGNYFKTEEEAKFEVERIKVIAELKEWATPISEIDWEDDKRKYILEVRSTKEKCFLAIDYDYDYQLSDLYFESKEIAENAIKAIGEDRIIKYYFRRGEM
jgi:hypothetical protein